MLEEYKQWYSRLSGYEKWFIVLVLTRPILDMFYFLKHVSILLSPLYIIGVLTPIIILVSLISRKRVGRTPRGQSVFFGVILLASLNLVVYGFQAGISTNSIQLVLKVVTVYMLILYFTKYLNTEEDLMRIMQTVFVSCFFPVLMLLYEAAAGPVGEVQYSRGVSRIQGLYADAVSYGMYTVIFMISGLYLNIKSGRKLINRVAVLIFIVVVISLMSINHVATMAVSSVVTLLYFTQRKRAVGFIAVALALIITIIASIEEDSVGYNVMLSREMEILEGGRPIEQGLHGRVDRWIGYNYIWSELGPLSQLFGVSFEIEPEQFPGWVLGGVHSDYLRQLYLTGIIGLILYAIYIFSLLSSSGMTSPPERFLSRGIIFVIVLYSVTTIPSLYPPIVYFYAPVFGYLMIRKH